jgi:membrane fusion protein, multidrug efflux system
MINRTSKTFLLPFLMVCLASTGFAQSAQKQMPPTVVKIYKAQTQSWQNSINVVGSLSAFNGVMLTSEIGGRITAINVSEGKNVKQGDLLVVIYPDIIKAQLQKDQADLVYNQKTYDRYLVLSKKGYVSQAELDRQKSALDMNKASIASDIANLNQHYVRAPFSGRLGVNLVSLGDYISTGTQLVSLQQFDPMRIDFNIPDSYLNQVKKGDQVEISSKAFPQKFTGTIYALDSAVDVNTRTLAARAKVLNPNNVLVPGTYVEVAVHMEQTQSLIAIPQTAIVYSTSGSYVYLMVDHKAVRANVTLGDKIANGLVVVTKGLKVNDLVITEGQTKLTDNAPVMTVQEYQQMAKTMAAPAPAK